MCVKQGGSGTDTVSHGSNVDDSSSPLPSQSSFSFSLEGQNEGGEEGGEEEDEDDVQDLWSMDRTMLADLPLLWDMLGTICRSTSTAMSLARTPQEGEPILLTWREECEVSVKSLVHVLFVINILASRREGLMELDDILREAPLVLPDDHSAAAAAAAAATATTANATLTQCEEVVQRIGHMSLFTGDECEGQCSSGKSTGAGAGAGVGRSVCVRVWSTLCGCSGSGSGGGSGSGSGGTECAVVFSEVMFPLYGQFLTALSMRTSPLPLSLSPLAAGAGESVHTATPLHVDLLKSDDLLIILKVSTSLICCIILFTLMTLTD